jgi:hypothetical protein
LCDEPEEAVEGALRLRRLDFRFGHSSLPGLSLSSVITGFPLSRNDKGGQEGYPRNVERERSGHGDLRT